MSIYLYIPTFVATLVLPFDRPIDQIRPTFSCRFWQRCLRAHMHMYVCLCAYCFACHITSPIIGCVPRFIYYLFKLYTRLIMLFVCFIFLFSTLLRFRM